MHVQCMVEKVQALTHQKEDDIQPVLTPIRSPKVKFTVQYYLLSVLLDKWFKCFDCVINSLLTVPRR